MDFLNHREVGYGFLSGFSPFYFTEKNCKRLREFKEIEISSKAVDVTVNNKVENSLGLLSGFLP